MFINERFKVISEYLQEHKKATVEQLSQLLYVSDATIRRDLIDMQKMGMLERSHGGAIYIEDAEEVSIFIRQGKNAKEKEIAASIALNHMPIFQTVFIDNSSTCLALAERMNLMHKTVITNGLQIAMKLSQKEGVHLIMPGGEVNFNTNSVTGSITCNQLRNFNADLMLSSCSSLDEKGVYEQSIETMQLKQIAFEQCKQRLLVVDSNKFFQAPTYRSSIPSAYDAIITNADNEQIRPLTNLGIKIYNHL